MEKTKMTRVEMFNAIKERVADNADMVAFLDHQIELISKKSTNKKPTKTQEENEVLKSVIVEVLGTDGITVSELQTKDERISVASGISNQRVSALLRQLKTDNKVDKRVEGKKTLYFLVQSDK